MAGIQSPQHTVLVHSTSFLHFLTNLPPNQVYDRAVDLIRVRDTKCEKGQCPAFSSFITFLRKRKDEVSSASFCHHFT